MSACIEYPQELGKALKSRVFYSAYFPERNFIAGFKHKTRDNDSSISDFSISTQAPVRPRLVASAAQTIATQPIELKAYDK